MEVPSVFAARQARPGRNPNHGKFHAQRKLKAAAALILFATFLRRLCELCGSRLLESIAKLAPGIDRRTSFFCPRRILFPELLNFW